MIKIKNAYYWLFSCLLVLMLQPELSRAQDSAAKEYKIYAVDQQRIISLTDMIEQLGDVDVLFFGEEHNDNIGHWLQDRIYALLLDQFNTVTLSLEMFETDCQYILDEYLAGFITESKLTKDARAWKNYQNDYKPLVEQAKTKQQVVIAANAPRRYVNLVSRKGISALEDLPKSAKQYLAPLPINYEDTDYYQRFQDIMGMEGHAASDKIYQAQCTWDATMAHSIYQHWRKHKKDMIFHLNGRFHTDFKQGTINQLRRLNKKIEIRNISCFPIDDFDQPNWSDYSTQADFIIVSPSETEKMQP